MTNIKCPKCNNNIGFTNELNNSLKFYYHKDTNGKPLCSVCDKRNHVPFIVYVMFGILFFLMLFGSLIN